MDYIKIDKVNHNQPSLTSRTAPQNPNFISPLFQRLILPLSHSHSHQHIDVNYTDSSDSSDESDLKNAPKP